MDLMREVRMENVYFYFHIGSMVIYFELPNRLISVPSLVSQISCSESIRAPCHG